MAASLLRLVAVRLLGYVVQKIYKVALMLRLGVLLLERDLGVSAPQAREAVTPAERAALQQLRTGAAWADFCDTLRGLGEAVLAGPSPDVPLDDVDVAEGHRYLTRLMRAGLEGFMEGHDPAWPSLRPLPHNVRIGADNPDNLYQFASISGAHSYRLVGTRGSVAYLSFAVYSGARPGLGSPAPAHLDSGRLVTGDGGAFEIALSAERPPGTANWLPLAPDATRLVVRQTFLDRGTEAAAALRLQRVAAPGEERPALSAQQVTSGLAGAGVLAAGSAMQFGAWTAMFAARHRNRLATLDHETYMTAWADPSIHFYHGYWALGEGEALVVALRPPECCYWNFQLNNVWMESIEDAGRAAPSGAGAASDAAALPPAADDGVDACAQAGGGAPTTVNKATARVRSDGTVLLVVARQQPPPAVLEAHGAQWVGTAGHHHGTMALRWVLARSHPDPHGCVLTRVDALDAGLSIAAACIDDDEAE